MIQSTDFVRQVKALAATNPTYRIRGRGADGTCDCIGLIMGAMYRNGHAKYDLHSTNYFARYETDGLVELDGSVNPSLGAIVYKARPDTGQLNERYRQGGTHHASDSLDYYHVGVVTGVNPLEITHCTETNNINGIAYDNSLRGWTHCGWVKGVTRSYEEGESDMAGYMATVTAANGQPVKMRSGPNTRNEKNVLKKLAVGTVVEVVDEGTSDGVAWSTIVADGVRGYMMSQFLKAEQPEGENASADATPHPSATPTPSPRGEGIDVILGKLDEIILLLKKSADGARKDNEIQYTDTE